MSAAPQDLPAADEIPPGGIEPVLDELEQVLRQQIHLCGNQEYDALAALNARAESLLSRATAATGPLSPEASESIRRIRALHNQLNLALALRRSELTERLGALGRGRQTLRAYKE